MNSRNGMTRFAKQELRDIQVGLHMAMDALINRQDGDQAEVILRQVDNALAVFINSAPTVD